MSVETIQLEPAYLLHRRDYRDSSLILELFTRHFGRISVIAKGVKRLRQPVYRYCQLFYPLLVSCRGRSELKNLVSLELNQEQWVPKLSRMALISGFYLNELLMRLIPVGDEHQPLFDAYKRTLQALSQVSQASVTDASTKVMLGSREAIEVALRRFELLMLAELGFGLDFQLDSEQNRPIQEDRTYQFQGGYGFRLASEPDGCASFLGQPIIPGRILVAMANEDFSKEETRRYAKKLLRSVINEQLGGRSLKVKELLL